MWINCKYLVKEGFCLDSSRVLDNYRIILNQSTKKQKYLRHDLITFHMLPCIELIDQSKISEKALTAFKLRFDLKPNKAAVCCAYFICISQNEFLTAYCFDLLAAIKLTSYMKAHIKSLITTFDVTQYKEAHLQKLVDLGFDEEN